MKYCILYECVLDVAQHCYSILGTGAIVGYSVHCLFPVGSVQECMYIMSNVHICIKSP